MSNVAGTMTTGRQAAAPYDRSALARAILSESARAVSAIMMPSVDMFPDRGVTLNQIAVAANSQSNAINLTFPTDGYTVGLAATTEDGEAASMAGMLCQVQVDGRDQLWASGQGNGAGFKPFSQISGAFSNGGYWRFRRQFLQATAWTVILMNTTGGQIICDLEFAIVDTRNPPP
jgi:hypothetical protein